MDSDIDILDVEEFEVDANNEKEVLMSYLNQFATLFPNWKPEYQMIHTAIKKNF